MSGDDHKKAFERWRKRQPPKRRLLIDAVRDIVLPEIEKRGFVRNNNYWANDAESTEVPNLLNYSRKQANLIDILTVEFSRTEWLFFYFVFSSLV